VGYVYVMYYSVIITSVMMPQDDPCEANHPCLMAGCHMNLPLTPLISIAGKRKILTYTQDTTRAKIERLCSTRLIHRDQKNTN
jgi:hypothetical protein